MIIKGLFRRYERWNPVHPTSGAFWGIGIGIGCGVGWGPGFGPEVVGYVGAGCGAGFSVGVTFAGIGIGLPANYVYSLPYSVLLATKNVALEAAQSRNSLSVNNWTENIHGLQQKAGEMVSAIGRQNPFEKGLDLDMAKMRTALCSNTKHAIDQFERISGNFFNPNKGNKD